MPSSLKPWLVALLMAACVVYFLHDRASQRMLASRGPIAETPTQTRSSAPVLKRGVFTIEPVADYRVRARVLAIERYRLGREAELSPVDFALGWGPMSDDAVLSQLSVSQANRWYMYRWQGAPPLEPSVIIMSSANTHLVPATPQIERQLLAVQKGAVVRLTGQLINAQHPDGWRWNSSLSRTDSGGGSCELMWVTDVEVESGAQ
jgi:hypothetical protein